MLCTIVYINSHMYQNKTITTQLLWIRQLKHASHAMEGGSYELYYLTQLVPLTGKKLGAMCYWVTWMVAIQLALHQTVFEGMVLHILSIILGGAVESHEALWTLLCGEIFWPAHKNGISTLIGIFRKCPRLSSRGIWTTQVRHWCLETRLLHRLDQTSNQIDLLAHITWRCISFLKKYVT